MRMRTNRGATGGIYEHWSRIARYRVDAPSENLDRHGLAEGWMEIHDINAYAVELRIRRQYAR